MFGFEAQVLLERFDISVFNIWSSAHDDFGTSQYAEFYIKSKPQA